MGVPGFFAWLLKKFAHKANISKASCAEFNMIRSQLDCKVSILYIDANCLFHPQCFKVLEQYDKTNIENLEKKMIQRILNYIDYLIAFVKPTDGVYISVDGVAPMAKMSQQRKRRFKTVEDNVLKDKIKKKYNMNTNTIWTNSSITPGTVFMEKLHNAIQLHIKKNKLGLNLTYTYSSYHTVGEGEHKILQDIKKKPDDGTYVIYGLDADLIFLALASDKSNIYLLREETFLKNSREKVEIIDIITDVAEELNYVSIEETRRCINLQICALAQRDQINYDFTYDFIVLCYFLGNDFMPNLPSIDIRNGGLDIILKVYIDTFLTLRTGLLDTDGINMVFLEIFLEGLASLEDQYFQSMIVKHDYRNCHSTEPFEKEIWNMENMRSFEVTDTVKLGWDKPDLWKYRYYDYYYKITQQDELIALMCDDFLVGLKWTMDYYFTQVPSWNWYYKYHNAPFVSDLYNHVKRKNTDINKIIFPSSQPVTPLVQLLAVIPPTFAELLPPSYVKVLKKELVDLFPTKVVLDLLNKDSLHKCMPFIPNIEIDRIINAVKNIKLTADETTRNTISDEQIRIL